MKQLRRHPRILIGGTVLAVLVLLSLTASLIAPFDGIGMRQRSMHASVPSRIAS